MSVNFVAVMAKYPELSKVKTRLAKTIGDKKALIVYNMLLQNLVDNCSAHEDNSFKLGCFITPVSCLDKFKKLYPSFAFYEHQKEGDLGEKMHKAFVTIFSELKAEKAILIGADIPNLNRNIIEDAILKLSTHDIVFGPTDDGGYYLIGMNKEYLELFNKVSWGTSTVLDQSLKICKKLSLSTHLLNTLSDLDTEEDLNSHQHFFKKMQ